MPSRSDRRYAAILVFGLTVLLFLPVVRAGLLNWEDYGMFRDCLEVRSLRLSSLWWMLTTTNLSTFQPLIWLLIAVVGGLSGFSPSAFHAASVLLHAANATAFFLLLEELLREALPGEKEACLRRAAAAAALLWALHPQQVEGVAWASALADLAATFFFLQSLRAYLAARSGRKDGSLWPAWLWFLGSSLCRWKGVCLPIALVFLDVYPLRRRPAWKEKIPFAALSALVLLINAHAKTTELGFHAVFRPEAAVEALALYLRHLATPWPLLPAYVLGASPWPDFLSDLVLLLGFAALAAGLAARKRPALALALLFYAASVAPTLAQGPDGWMHGHDFYAYLAGLGLFAALAGVLQRSRPLAAAVLCLPVLAALSLRQAASWRDPAAFWTRLVAVAPGPRSSWAYQRAGAALLEQGRYYEAIAWFRQQAHYSPLTARANIEYAYRRMAMSRP